MFLILNICPHIAEDPGTTAYDPGSDAYDPGSDVQDPRSDAYDPSSNITGKIVKTPN